MDIYIITGASKGIGLALSRRLVEAGAIVYGIARTEPAGWPGKELLKADLGRSEEIPELIGNVMKKVAAHGAERVTLINNAGVIEPIGRAENHPHKAVMSSLSVNLAAPMLLCTGFLKAPSEDAIEKRIINISSGAGRNPLEGWSAYCATKAGLDHYSRCLKLEYPDVPVISVAPGIIDTDMQSTIRKSDAEDFPALERFRAYKEEGVLSTPEETAAALVNLFGRDDFGRLDTILDLRDYA